MSTFKVIGIAGSLRKEAFSKKLAKVAESHLPAGVSYSILDWSQVPIFNQDLEGPHLPQAVKDVRNQVAGADAIFIATPEYNYSIPGPLKNLIDWISRPYDPNNDWNPTYDFSKAQLPLSGKAVAIAGLSPFTGGAATGRAHPVVREALVYPGAYVVQSPPMVAIDGGNDAIENGKIKGRNGDSLSTLLANLVKLGKQLKTNVD